MDYVADAYLYSRFSKMEQMRGDSLRRQSAKVEKFCREKKLRLVTELRDLGISAYRSLNRQRGSLAVIFEMVKDGRIKPGSWLLFESFDRLSRDEPMDALAEVQALLKAGITLATLADERVYSREGMKNDRTAAINMLLIQQRANKESEMKSIRSRSAWVGKREKGIRLAICPGWLKLGPDGKYEPIREPVDRVAIVQEIFQLAASGMGGLTIARILNERGVPTFNSKVEGKPRTNVEGKGWYQSRIYAILAEKAPLGVYQPKLRTGEPDGDPIEGYYPAIIDAALWHRAAAARRIAKPRKQGRVVTNLFDDLCTCLCGSSMRIMRGKTMDRKYLVCTSYYKRLGCTDGTYWHYQKIEGALLSHVQEYRLSEVFRGPEADDYVRKAESEIIKLTEEIGDCERRQKVLLERLSRLDPEDPLIDGYESSLRELRQQIDMAKATRVQAEGLRAEMLAQRDDRADVDRVIEELRAKLLEADDTEATVIRRKLQAAFRSWVWTIRFDGSTGHIHVIPHGGLRQYRFLHSGGKGAAKTVVMDAILEREQAPLPHHAGNLMVM